MHVLISAIAFPQCIMQAMFSLVCTKCAVVFASGANYGMTCSFVPCAHLFPGIYLFPVVPLFPLDLFFLRK